LQIAVIQRQRIIDRLKRDDVIDYDRFYQSAFLPALPAKRLDLQMHRPQSFPGGTLIKPVALFVIDRCRLLLNPKRLAAMRITKPVTPCYQHTTTTLPTRSGRSNRH
jgi:hypothetical protein